MHRLRSGNLLPKITLGRYVDGLIEPIRLDELLSRGRGLVVGVPGAFTPVCTTQHVPDFVRNAATLRASGYDHLICVAPNDPFTLEAWRTIVDPKGQLMFLSDGNWELSRALAVEASHSDLFLSRSTHRYLLTTRDQIVSHLAIEPVVTLLTCTRSTDLPMAA